VISFSWRGLSLCSTVVDAVLAGLFQSVAAGLADRLAAALVFVVARHISDRRVQPHSVVLGPYPVEFEFEFEFAWVADLLQLWPLTLHVPEQGLDPGLVGRRRRAPGLLRDGQRSQ
jgi:hypothetical protein